MSAPDCEAPAFWVDGRAVDEPTFIGAALDPAHSVAIQACAGSGKTWLLVARVVRLLLVGCEPSEILAITFTRKAAEEMRGRLARVLSALAIDDDDAVASRLADFGLDAGPAAALCDRARSLLERVLDDARPMTIDTFHGWFGQIVRNAPLAAGIPHAFAISEQSGFLRREAWRRFLAAMTRQSTVRTAYLDLLARCGEANTHTLLDELLARRNDWEAYLDGRTPADALGQLGRELGVEGLEDPRAQYLADPGVRARIAQICASLSEGTSTEQASAARGGAALAGLATGYRAEHFQAVNDLVRSRKVPTQQAQIAARRRGGATEVDRLLALCASVAEDLARAAAAGLEFDVLGLNRAAWICAESLIGHYQGVKSERGVQDFDDLEALAARLSRDPVSGAYIQARLDTRYRHILVDEFQDTNPLQWLTLKSWLDAYGADGLAPSVFLVGDPAQSIYRFRRAEPRLFVEAERFLVERFNARALRTTLTRRCPGAVVDLINRVFVGANPRFLAHRTLNRAGGAALCLPLIAPVPAATAAAAPRALRDILVEPVAEERKPQREHEAAAIAAYLRELFGSGRIEERDASGSRERAITYRDVLILVRKRDSMQPIELGLRAAGIPYSSDRRGGLLGTLEALDLCALLKFLVVPFSDLYLAHVLRSPIFGFGDDDLIELARRPQDGATWWQRLRARSERASFVGASSALARWIGLAGVLPIHDLLDRIFHEGALVERYTASVPCDAASAETDQVRSNLLAFLELALALDSGRFPSLPRFIAELELLADAPDTETPDEGITDFGNTVRIMTIHGAKGLESPVVVLTDTVSPEPRSDPYDVLIDWPPGDDRPRHVSVYGAKASRGAAREAFFAEEESLKREQEWNLLYVAVTRARNILVLSGVASTRGVPPASWFARCEAALGPFAGPSPALLGPPALNGDASYLIRDFRPARQSTGARAAAAAQPGAAGEAARRRGIALHRVLELLPIGPLTSERATAIAQAAGLDPERAREIGATALVMLGAPHLARFFDVTQFVEAANEVEFVDAAGAIRRIDRLVEFDDEVWVLDYKSQSSSAGVDAHRTQLECYTELVRSAYPDRRVRGAVVFADGVLAPLSE